MLGTSIEQGSQHIDERLEFSHCEIDTVLGTNKKGEAFAYLTSLTIIGFLHGIKRASPLLVELNSSALFTKGRDEATMYILQGSLFSFEELMDLEPKQKYAAFFAALDLTSL